ncbi:hypothetical protein BCR42DRAFT_325418 [Absidia repens]|uniref:Uncharacterized protein n=1 Tax=Absidia repens TaxID=90262 RepID=A0A1X2IK79_9FUNG|nr:hypothetical protein BCR42DRAFT_325418 [Absidia repens]
MSLLSPRSSYSISSVPESTIATPPRFSVNLDLMNYSIPKNNNLLTLNNHTNHKRDIQQGNSYTRTRQLEAQVEALTLSNVKLQRSNRLLKVDTDNIIEQRTQPLQSTIRELTLNNIQLQRSTRLLQQDLEEKSLQLNQYQTDQVVSMKTVGPEYEYLINGDVHCEETCCYTMAPVDHSSSADSQHSCRPIIHSTISQGSYATELEHKIAHLERIIEELTAEKESMAHQQSYKDDDLQTLKSELEMKDAIVSQLEQDFMDLENKLTVIQKVGEIIHIYITQDPARQSHMLMESKRRTLAIKDTELLEKILRSQRYGITPPSPTSSLDQEDASHEEDEDDNDDEKTHSDTPSPITTCQPPSWTPFLSTTSLPCKYNASSSCSSIQLDKSLAPPGFILMTVFLGCASQMGITDDWTLPLTLTLMVSGFLWTGGAKGVQLKVKI